MTLKRIPFSRPFLGEEEIAEVADTLRSGWLTTGPKTRRFEEDFARSCQVPHALGTSSCTGALHLGVMSLGIEPGDEVITSCLTFAATANVVVHSGGRPVFVDVDPATLCLDPAQVEARITPRTRGVIGVHYAGRPCDMDRLRALCQARGLWLLEDAAHGVGGVYRGRPIGSLGDAAGFSFYANKNMTTGEGGMFTTSSDQVLQKARVLRLQGMTRDLFRREGGGSALPRWRYEIVEAGFKYPMSDIEAAIGIHQLRRLPQFQEARRQAAERYSRELADLPSLQLPSPIEAGSVHAWHLYVVRVAKDGPLDRDQLFSALADQGIDCSVHFVPLHLQPYFQRVWKTAAGQFPLAEAAFEEILSLPLFPGLLGDDQTRVIETIHACLTR